MPILYVSKSGDFLSAKSHAEADNIVQSLEEPLYKAPDITISSHTNIARTCFGDLSPFMNTPSFFKRPKEIASDSSQESYLSCH